MSPEYVLYDMSYENLVMYSSVIPSYNTKKEVGNIGSGKRINADDSRNNDEILRIISGK